MDEQHVAAAVAALSALIGTWRGTGIASFPSMDPIAFDDEIRFSARTPTSVDYWLRAVATGDGSMLHSEAGIWRVSRSGGLEISVALPGATEISEGSIEGGSIHAESTAVGLAATGARLRSTLRHYELDGDSLSYEVSMATEAIPQSSHIAARLTRSSPA